MPKKNSRARSAKQAEIAAQKSALLKQRQREYKEFQKRVAKEKLALERKREKDLKTILKKSREVGLYNPKSDELTRYRKKRLRGIKEQYGQYLDDNKYFFLPAGEQARKRILERASNLQMPTTRTGLFIPREGHKSAKLKKSKKRDEFYIERRGKTKTGVNKGRVYKDITPLASVDELDRERDRIRKMAARFGQLSEDDRLVFKIVENGVEGYSHSTFTNIEQLIKYLEKYPKSVAARVNFFRHIKIERSSVNEWFSRHKPRSPGKRDRRKLDTRRSKG
jgi:hypothetical protein